MAALPEMINSKATRYPAPIRWPQARTGAVAWPVQGGQAGLLFGGDYFMADGCTRVDAGGKEPGSKEVMMALPPDDLTLHNEAGWFHVGGRGGWQFESADAESGPPSTPMSVTSPLRSGFSLRPAYGAHNHAGGNDQGAAGRDPDGAGTEGSKARLCPWPLGRARAQHWQLGRHSLLFSGRFSGPVQATSIAWGAAAASGAQWAYGTKNNRQGVHLVLKKSKQILLTDLWRFSLELYGRAVGCPDWRRTDCIMKSQGLGDAELDDTCAECNIGGGGGAAEDPEWRQLVAVDGSVAQRIANSHVEVDVASLLHGTSRAVQYPGARMDAATWTHRGLRADCDGK